MTTSLTDHAALAQSHAYIGEAHGVRFTCSPASYAEGKMTLRLECLTDTGGMKGAADRLAEALNGKWSNRCKGYHLAPSRALLWRALFVAGYDAELDCRGGHYSTKEAPKIEAPDGRKLSLKEAAAEVSGKSPAKKATKPKNQHARTVHEDLTVSCVTVIDSAAQILDVQALDLATQLDLAELILAAQDACNYMGDCVVSNRLRKALPAVFEEPTT